MYATGEAHSLCPSETPAIFLAAPAALLHPFSPSPDRLLQHKHCTENNSLLLGKKLHGLTEPNILENNLLQMYLLNTKTSAQGASPRSFCRDLQ